MSDDRPFTRQVLSWQEVLMAVTYFVIEIALITVSTLNRWYGSACAAILLAVAFSYRKVLVAPFKRLSLPMRLAIPSIWAVTVATAVATDFRGAPASRAAVAVLALGFLLVGASLVFLFVQAKKLSAANMGNSQTTN